MASPAPRVGIHVSGTPVLEVRQQNVSPHGPIHGGGHGDSTGTLVCQYLRALGLFHECAHAPVQDSTVMLTIEIEWYCRTGAEFSVEPALKYTT